MKMLHRLNASRLIAGTAIVVATLALSARADYPSTVLSQNPAGYWRLDETAQPPVLPIAAANAGSLGASSAGELVNVTRGVPGAIPGDALNLGYGLPGASDNRVRIPYQPQWNNGPFTVEFWAMPGTTSGTLCPAASVWFSTSGTAMRNGWLFYQTGNGWSFRMYQTVASGSGTVLADAAVSMPLSTSQYYHIVGVFDGASSYLYTNGVLATKVDFLTATFRPNTNTAIPLTFGARADGNAGYFPYIGKLDEAAVYASALTPERILAHYQAGVNASASTYSTTVQADAPAGYWRFNEPGDPGAANLGSLGAAGNGTYQYNARPGVVGARPPSFNGLDAGNNAVAFDGVGGGLVSLPAMNLNTNTVTITGWLNATGSQAAATGLILSRSGTTVAGLTSDSAGGNGLTYNWNNDANAYNWVSGLALPDSTWAFVALVVRPTEAAIYLGNGTDYSTFASATNLLLHANQKFEGRTLIGADVGFTPTRFFNGAIDEVAIFGRSLSAGEVYSQYAAAVGGVPVRIFGDPQAPLDQVFAGDTLTLTVDAGGTPNLTYQWRKGGSPIANATTSVYTKSGVDTGDSASYDVVVSNGIGTPATSQAAVVTVNPLSAPTIVENPLGRTIYPGGTLTLAVVASGGGLKYQWKKDNNNIDGATNASYVVSSVAAGAAGVYVVTVNNNLGPAVTSTTATVVVAAPAAGSYAAVVNADAPEAWWRLGESANSVIMFDSMGRHDGYYTNLSGSPVTLGAASALFGDPDTAVLFDGSSASYGVIPFSPVLNNGDITVECWAKTTVTSGISPVSSRYAKKGYWFHPDTSNPSGWGLGVNANNTDYRVPSTAASGALAAGWTHLALTYSGAVGMRLYINGQWDGANYVDYERNGAGPMLIGARGESAGLDPSQFFNGPVDEVAVYTKALSQAQIQAHYQGRYGTTTKPIFRSQPSSQTVSVGTAVSFSGSAEGSLPLGYQWYKDGAPVAGATGTSLSFASAALGDSGSYQLMATNAPGSTASATVSLLVLPTPLFANATNQLVLHLKFDGDYADASGTGNSATANGTPSFVAGKVGANAVHLNTDTAGSAFNYVQVATSPSLAFEAADSFSVSFWLKYSGAFNDLPIIGNAVNSTYQKCWVFSEDGGKIEWTLTGSDVGQVIADPVGGPLINNGAWHNIVASFDRSTSTASTYVDGVLIDARSIAGVGSLDSFSALTFGQDPTGAYAVTGAFDLDDVGIWRRAVTPLEACAIYNAGNAGTSFDTYGPVNLGIAPSAGGLQLIWQAGTLLEADSLTGTWKAVAGATAPRFLVTPGTGNKFYRIQL